MIESHLRTQSTDAYNRDDSKEIARITAAEPSRWVAIGKTNLQAGLMALTRAVAQPNAF